MRVTTSTREKGDREDAAPGEPSGHLPRHAEEGHDPLLAAVCHDLRAPLAAVMMGAGFVLRTTPEGDTRARRVLEAMLRSCHQMERLVRDFADLSEIEQGSITLQLGTHDAAELLELAAQAVRPRAAARDVAVDLERPAAPVMLRCDRERVARALEHVLDNAARVAPDGSTVRASVRREGGEVVFQIVDTGPGLSRETMAHLYDRAWHASRPSRSGSGLGLAIVRGFVLAHDGCVDVDSEPGEGAAFSLAFPAAGPPPSADARHGGERPSGGAPSEGSGGASSGAAVRSREEPSSGGADPRATPR